MAKRKLAETVVLQDSPFTGELVEGVEQPAVEQPVKEEQPAAEVKKAVSKKTKMTVDSIMVGKFFVKDDKGNGYIIPMDEKNKDSKVGDTLYI